MGNVRSRRQKTPTNRTAYEMVQVLCGDLLYLDSKQIQGVG